MASDSGLSGRTRARARTRASARAELIDALDDALVSVQRVPRRPGYRRRLLGSLDLPGGLGAFRVLRAVERAPDRAPSIGDIAEALAVDPSTASRVVERCVGAGLLTRTAQAGDRRRARLRLTDAGSDLLGQVSRNRRDVLGEVAGDWDDENLEQLLRLLRTLLAGLGRLEVDP